jgi:hypothetical protein
LVDRPVPELTRRRRVVDQMLTAHSVLRDRYARRAATVDLGGLAFSVIICLLTFVDPTLLRYFGADDILARIATGLSAACVFFVSLVQLRVDWKTRSAEHERAVERLARAKALYRRTKYDLENPHDGSKVEPRDTFQEVDLLLEDVTAIPDNEFVALKAIHNRKVIASRIVDRYPGTSLLLVRCALWWRHTRDALRNGGPAHDGEK